MVEAARLIQETLDRALEAAATIQSMTQQSVGVALSFPELSAADQLRLQAQRFVQQAYDRGWIRWHEEQSDVDAHMGRQQGAELIAALQQDADRPQQKRWTHPEQCLPRQGWERAAEPPARLRMQLLPQHITESLPSVWGRRDAGTAADEHREEVRQQTQELAAQQRVLHAERRGVAPSLGDNAYIWEEHL